MIGSILVIFHDPVNLYYFFIIALLNKNFVVSKYKAKRHIVWRNTMLTYHNSATQSNIQIGRSKMHLGYFTESHFINRTIETQDFKGSNCKEKNLLRFKLNSPKIPCQHIRLEQERQAHRDHYCHESSAGPFTNIYQLKTVIHQIFIL